MDILNGLIPCAVAILSACISYLISRMRSDELSREIKTIQEYLDTSDNSYFVNCPQCQYKINLNDVRIHAEKREDK